jgi:hypothetical protein
MCKVRCKRCGSADVELRAWVKPNMGCECTHSIDFSNTVLENKADCYCCNCQENVTLIIEEEE